MKKLSETDTNNLSYALNDKLQDATAEFAQERDLNVNVAVGAANLYLATWLTYAPNRKMALEALEKDVEIIRNIIKQTPDHFFGGAKNLNLN